MAATPITEAAILAIVEEAISPLRYKRRSLVIINTMQQPFPSLPVGPVRHVPDRRPAGDAGEALREDQEEVSLLDRLPAGPPRRARIRVLHHPVGQRHRGRDSAHRGRPRTRMHFRAGPAVPALQVGTVCGIYKF